MKEGQSVEDAVWKGCDLVKLEIPEIVVLRGGRGIF